MTLPILLSCANLRDWLSVSILVTYALSLHLLSETAKGNFLHYSWEVNLVTLRLYTLWSIMVWYFRYNMNNEGPRPDTWGLCILLDLIIALRLPYCHIYLPLKLLDCVLLFFLNLFFRWALPIFNYLCNPVLGILKHLKTLLLFGNTYLGCTVHLLFSV